VVDPPVVEPPAVDPPVVDPPMAELPPLDTVAFISMKPPLAMLELDPDPAVEPDVPVAPLVDPAPPAPAIRQPVTVTS
jgi:DNA polymerase-3 subunit gamma/tau